MLNKCRYFDDNAGVVLIPHHGADSDDLLWLDDRSHSRCGCASLVVAYGNDNPYGHPCFIFDGSMARIKNRVAFANEENEYRYGVLVCD